MSSFSNPFQDAGAAGSKYVSDLLEVLGDRDPIAELEQFPSELDRAIRGLDQARLRKPEREGKWSIAQVVRHLADTEIVLAFRYRMVIAQDRPPITGYDQDLWAQRLGYAEADLDESLELLRLMRHSNLRLLRSLRPAQFDRIGLHSERGPESLGTMMKLEAAHDLVHLRQIERIKQAIK